MKFTSFLVLELQNSSMASKIDPQALNCYSRPRLVTAHLPAFPRTLITGWLKHGVRSVPTDKGD